MACRAFLFTTQACLEGEHILVTEKVAEHRKASRRSVEASDLRRTVAGTETLPARYMPWLESCPSSVILMFEHVRRWVRRQCSPSSEEASKPGRHGVVGQIG